MSATVQIPHDLAKCVLIVGGILKRQVPEEVRGYVTHVQNGVDVFSIPTRIRHILIVQAFTTHKQTNYIRAYCPPHARVHYVSGSKSAVREKLRAIFQPTGGA